MKNVQISFDENLLEAVDHLASTSKISRSAIVRDALRHWLKHKQIKDFEDQWITALKQSPDDASSAESWVKAQSWSDK